MGASNATQSCLTDNNSNPPGNCTPEQHAALEAEKDEKCGGKRTCKGLPLKSCQTYLQNIQKNLDCAVARETIMVTCFPPMGNKGHRMAMEEALNAAAYCERRFNAECKVEEPQPAPVPVEDKDFMKKMSEITKLTGTALIIYVIISEGSRLFPPRNLVPVP